MNEQIYRVSLCGLSARDERVISVILSRVLSPRFRYELAAPGGRCEIALTDPDSPDAEPALRQLRAGNPYLVVLRLTDSPPQPGARMLVSRRNLWSHLVAALDDVAQHELHRLRNQLRETSAIVAPPSPPVTATTARPPAPGAAPAVPARLRALVLDDSATVRTQLDAALLRLGIASDGAAGWDAAAQLLEQRSYDILFLDVVMPGVDGYEACRRVRRNAATRRLPVVMLTSRSSPFDRARGALAGCDLYLVKPIDLSAFQAAVNKIVAKLCHNDLVAARSRGFIPAAAGWPSH